jgi:hypothetical protein
MLMVVRMHQSIDHSHQDVNDPGAVPDYPHEWRWDSDLTGRLEPAERSSDLSRREVRLWPRSRALSIARRAQWHFNRRLVSPIFRVGSSVE